MFETITKGTVKGKALVELQSLKYALVTGANSGVGIPVANGVTPPVEIKEDDTVVAILEWDSAVPSLVDKIGQDYTLSAGEITFTSYVSTGKQLLILWYVKPVGGF